MSDSPVNEPLHRPKRKNALRTWWSSLSAPAQGFLTLGAFASLVVAGTRGCDSVVRTSELAAFREAQAKVDAEQDKELEQGFILNNLLKQEVGGLREQAKWTNDVLWKMAQDTGLDRGRDRVEPPPATKPVPSPHPTVTP